VVSTSSWGRRKFQIKKKNIRKDVCYAFQRFIDVLKAFTRIQLTSTKKYEINIATALKKKLENAEFVLHLCVWEKF